MSFIPSKDADLLAWGSNITSKLTADPGRYGVSASEALLVQGEQDDFAAALSLTDDPATRSPSAIAHKDGLKALFLADVRVLAGIIRSNRGVSNEDKASLGLTIPDPVPTPVPVPSTTCNLTIIGATPSLHTITYKDSNIAVGKSKPYGVTAALLYREIAAVPHDNFNDANPSLVGLFTKSPLTASIPNGSRGKLANYWTQWVTRKGQVGPLAGPFTFVCP